MALFKRGRLEVKGGKLVNAATGQPFDFEILLDSGRLFERIVGPFVKNLERLGIAVDASAPSTPRSTRTGWTTSTST